MPLVRQQGQAEAPNTYGWHELGPLLRQDEQRLFGWRWHDRVTRFYDDTNAFFRQKHHTESSRSAKAEDSWPSYGRDRRVKTRVLRRRRRLLPRSPTRSPGRNGACWCFHPIERRRRSRTDGTDRRSRHECSRSRNAAPGQVRAPCRRADGVASTRSYPVPPGFRLLRGCRGIWLRWCGCCAGLVCGGSGCSRRRSSGSRLPWRAPRVRRGG